MNLSKNSRTVKQIIINIENEETFKEQLKKFGRAEGVITEDTITGELNYKAYNRKPIKRRKAKLLRELDFGWLKESKELIIRREAFPKRLGTSRILSLMDGGNRQAKDGVIERELDLIEFC